MLEGREAQQLLKGIYRDGGLFKRKSPFRRLKYEATCSRSRWGSEKFWRGCDHAGALTKCAMGLIRLWEAVNEVKVKKILSNQITVVELNKIHK